MADTRRILAHAQTRLIGASANGLDTGPAADWLLDNYHVVQEQVDEVRASLPRDYYRELPELASGPLAGYPRVYEIAIALISHTEGRIDLDNVDLFVDSFQQVAPLSIGELWAMPAMLRLGLIESVRRMTLRTLQRLDDRELAVQWANHLLDAGAESGRELRAALGEFAEAGLPVTPDFIVPLLQTLRHSDGASPSLAWLEHWVRESGASPETAVATSAQRLALTQIMMGNSITSLRNVGQRDWRRFVEQQSAMEAMLRRDPSGDYALMTFATRDHYRHVVERIAKRSGHTETTVAQWALNLAARYVENGDAHKGGTAEPARAHVGYYLVDRGVPELDALASYPPTIRERVERTVRAHPDLVLLSGIASSTVGSVLAVLLLADEPARTEIWLVMLVAFFPALDIAVGFFNQLLTVWLPPRVLPRLDFHTHGVSAENRTVVVVPTLLGSVEDVRDALEHLEVQFLANREANLHFALLSDFNDCTSERAEADDAIIASAIEGVRTLNDRHAENSPNVFHVFHRPRRWNAAQKCWMGWERKRGKLADFNHLLRGGGGEAFSLMTSAPSALQGTRYVITLDADTVLPPDSAAELIGTMAHPLNRPVYDAQRRTVVRGYGVLQPQVGVSLPSAHRSRFAAIASGHPGVDPYTIAASDVYQDLYGEGSFTGKGIYDVDAFHTATFARFPENAVLSHDLLEGNYARAGLATDVMVYDDYPSTYAAWTRRKHRWVRGDWQLLPWLRPHVPTTDGRERNQLSLVSRWKIVDNLRRSTVEISQVLLLLAGWMVLPGSPIRWTYIGLGAVVAPWIIALLRAITQPPLDKSWRAYYGAVWRDALVSVQQMALTIIVLPHQALVSLDAIIRTLYRLTVSRRQLLDWQTASSAERGQHTDAMWPSPRVAAALVAVLALGISTVAIRRQLAQPMPLESIVPSAIMLWSLTLLWICAPWIMRRISAPTTALREPWSPVERETALRYAAAHWKYFDRFVTVETHYLVPDNFQSEPEPVVAMRTSPTNIGLQLLATVSAYDLALIDLEDMTTRLERAMHTLSLMKRFRGHLYNWYDLHDLRVMEPAYISTVDSGNLAGHLLALRQACLDFSAHPRVADHVRDRLRTLAQRAYTCVDEMDFTFLYDESRKLFTIGYHPGTFTADASFYDLLASEARLASFVAIAKSDAPVEHWFRLSRSQNRSAGAMALVSWSGSMFEYLMPVLVMRSLPFTMLDQTYHGVVARHRAYARVRRVPWGVSESAYNVRDRHDTYQYRGFGIANLALKRGLGRELVVAPYASALAVMIDPQHGLANLEALEALGAFGEFGFCDALDYTRPNPGERMALVQAHMAHHLGMTLVALTNVLHDDIWQSRFHADPLVKSAELLMHERVPRRLITHKAQRVLPNEALPDTANNEPHSRDIDTRVPSPPRVALLGVEPYSVMVNHNGAGFSRYGQLAVTRWNGDSTQDDAGQFVYLKDVASGRVWSAAPQPVNAPADASVTRLGLDNVSFDRIDGDLETLTTITVAAADCAEVRRVRLTNTGSRSRDIELTSYGELVLTSPDADAAHPAFSNLFVETEWHAWCSAITATRRRRQPDDPDVWCVHVVDAGAHQIGDVSCETDRARFIGRGRSVRDPIALESDGALSGSTGAVLDPIFALRTRVRVQPGQSVSVAFTTLVATSRADAFALADRYHDSHAAQRALDVAWSATQIELRELGISSKSAAMFQDMATSLLYRTGTLAPPRDEMWRNEGSQPTLWQYGLSGDLPIVLATIDAMDGMPTLRELLLAHRYWRGRGVRADLVIVNAHPHDYLQELRDGIHEALVAANDAAVVDKAGGVFVRRREDFDAHGLLMLTATARMIVHCDGRGLDRLLSSAITPSTPVAVEEPGRPFASIASALRPLLAPFIPPTSDPQSLQSRALAAPAALRFDNGIGGLDAHNDYSMLIDDDHLPPAPWSNIIANPHGGFLVSERGAGCTWAENAYFFRLTPWHNDPVSDPSSDALYIKDVESGELWSATPAPVRSDAKYRVTHGPGRSTFTHVHDEIETELTVGVPENAAVKLSLLRIVNHSSRRRRLSLTAYVEWTLGARRTDTQYQVRTRYVSDACAIFAQNHFDPAFSQWTAFLATSETVSSYSANRQSFVGRDGTLAAPIALTRTLLDGNTGVGLDPCAALQSDIMLAPGEECHVSVILGAASTEKEARRLITELQSPSRARAAMAGTRTAWEQRLGTIRVKTPDAAFDAMVNTWTLYQALSCRMWARMGLYQSSGAYGFRDQLQDVMAFVYAEPGIARAHILRASARQFVEGDVQHWWHPHTGRGVRTRFSDDLAWLPYVVDHYVRVTGDTGVLDEEVPFLTMRLLEPHEHEVYDLPEITDARATIYEHCRLALRRACTTGPHGLPLIGTGDWNDGMSRVGAEGTGESIWLAWFLVANLRQFAEHAARRGDDAEAAFMRTQADAYVAAVETSGWDGGWYRRAFYDDGTPLGSATSDECRIDAIAQSWSVISKAGDPARQQVAMDALESQLVREDARLIMLLTPPFDRGTHDPGYIKGYVPGVRENGAQYTHAALWAVMATAMQGRGDRAFELFQMLNPLTHADSPAGVDRYKVEPYVVAADVYTAPSQLGRGGWTWYTGSASWTYRIGLEQILGFVKVGDTLRVTPRVPTAWPAYTITYRFRSATYEITVRQPAAVQSRGAVITVNGEAIAEDYIKLNDDGQHHVVVIDAAQ